jgi:hypothetical protein
MFDKRIRFLENTIYQTISPLTMLKYIVLSSTCIQLLVFHCLERLHTVNMETTGRNILSQYELPKETHRKMLTHLHYSNLPVPACVFK